MKRKPALLAAAAIIAVLTISGCSSGGGNDPDGTGEAARGGSINIYTPALPASLMTGEPSAEYAEWPIYGTLIRFDENDEQISVIAESLTAEDPSTWLLTLREGLTFTDGTPFDSEAVKYNWEWHAVDENRSQARAASQQIASMDVVDPQTLRIALKAPNVEFDIAVATGPMNAIGSPTAMEADIAAFKRMPVAAGPFMVEEWVEGDHAKLVRNPDYFDPEKPYLDEINILPVPDFEQRLNVMSSGENALAMATNALEVAELEDLSLEVALANANGGYQYLLNNSRAPFDDVRVRQAVIQAIDREALNQAVYDGHQRWEDVPFRSTSPYFSEDVQQLPFDKDAAQELIDEYVDEVGPVEFTLTSTNTPTQVLEAQWLAQEYNTLDGVTVEIQTLESTAFAEAVTTGQFTMGFYGTNFLGSAANYRARLISTAPQNYEKYNNPEVDALFQEAAATIDINDRVPIVQEIQRITFEDAPIFWTFGGTLGWAASGDVRGVVAWGQDYYVPEELYLDGIQ